MAEVRYKLRKCDKSKKIIDSYIVNPAYILKQDGNRVFLGQRENVDEYVEKAYELQDIFSFIHPLNAQMLSFFNGEDDLETAIQKMSEYFSLSPEEAGEIAMKYVENEQTFSIPYKGKWQYFPKNLVIKKPDKVKRYRTYSLTDFACSGDPDFDTVRLSSPLTILLLPTMQCYTDCIYCYANRKMNASRMMTLDQIKSIIRQAREIGVEEVNLNGGEVLLHEYYKEIVEEVLKNGYNPVISTKVPLSEKVIDTLKSIGMGTIQVSLDAVNPEILKKMLRVNTSYIELMSGTLQYLSRQGFRVKIHSIVTSYNSSIEEFENLISFLSRFECVYRVQISPAGYSLYKPDFLHYRSSGAFMDSLAKYVDSIREKYSNIAFYFSGSNIKSAPEQKSEKFWERAVCTGNLKSFIILPDGRATICEDLYEHPRFIIGDLTRQSIMEVWNSQRAKDLFYLSKENISAESACKQCTSFDACRQGKGVCWKEALMAYGSERWDYPDTRCPQAPEVYNDIYLA